MRFTLLRGHAALFGAASLLAVAFAGVAPAQTTEPAPAATIVEAPASEAPATDATATDATAGTDQPASAEPAMKAPAADAPAAAETTAGETGSATAPASEAPAAEAATGNDTDGSAASASETPAATKAPGDDETDSAAASASENAGYAMGDIVLGDPAAPLTVIEYASFTCPHCGNFAAETFPKVKAQYIDTGKVKFILREVYFDQYGLWASMVARCGGEKGFYPLAHTFLTTQDAWTSTSDIGNAIYQVGRRAGLSADRLEQCLSDRAYAKDLLAAYQKNSAADKVESTPTFIVGGEKHVGEMDFEKFSAILDAAL